MPTGKIAAANDHLARLVGTRPVHGLAELVWNSVDANATTVAIEIRLGALGAVDEVVVADNGHGFAAEEIAELFSHVGGSWKHHAANRKTRDGERILHGDKGQGRWRAFSIGQRAVWESVVAGKDNEPNKKVRLVMSDQRLDEYDWSGPESTDENPGTTVTVIVGGKQPDVLVSAGASRDLANLLALYLTEYPGVNVTLDGNPLRVDDLILRRDELVVDYPNPYGPVIVTVIEWREGVERALYLCDENGATLHESAVRVHAPGFNFTAYVRWAGFRVHETLLPLAEMGNDEVGPAVEAARELIRSHFRERRVDDTKTVVQEWRGKTCTHTLKIRWMPSDRRSRRYSTTWRLLPPRL